MMPFSLLRVLEERNSTIDRMLYNTIQIPKTLLGVDLNAQKVESYLKSKYMYIFQVTITFSHRILLTKDK